MVLCEFEGLLHVVAADLNIDGRRQAQVDHGIDQAAAWK